MAGARRVIRALHDPRQRIQLLRITSKLRYHLPFGVWWRTGVTEQQDWLRFDFFPAGAELIAQGAPAGGSIMVLKEGEVEVLRDGKFVSTIKQAGAIFGEMSVLLDRPHSATVRAVTDVQLYVIDDAIKVLEAHPAWLLQIARLLAQRVNATTAQLVALKQRQGEGEDDDVLVLPTNLFASWADPQI